MATQIALGVTLLCLGAILIIPSSVGIAQYVNRVAALEKDNAAEQRLRAYFAIQIVILVLATGGIITAIYFLAKQPKVTKLPQKRRRKRRRLISPKTKI